MFTHGAQHVRAFQIELEFGLVGFQGEGKTGVPGEKPLGARERTNNKLNPHMASTPGWGPEISDLSCYRTLPQLLSLETKEKQEQKNFPAVQYSTF